MVSQRFWLKKAFGLEVVIAVVVGVNVVAFGVIAGAFNPTV